MAEFEPTEVQGLLNIVEKVSTVAPGMSHIIAECMARLRKINAGLEEAKSANQQDLGNLAGMPVTSNVPSQPLENPKSEVAQQAPEESEPGAEDLRPVDPAPANATAQTPAGPRAIPNPDYAEIPDTDPRDPQLDRDLPEALNEAPGAPGEPADPTPNVRRT